MAEGRAVFQLLFVAQGSWLICLPAPILAPFPVGGPPAYLGRSAVPRLAGWRFPQCPSP